MNILVVEDNPFRIKKFERALIGSVVDYTDNAHEGIIFVKEREYDIIFLDHDLGGREHVSSNDLNTGFQVAKAIKGTPNESAFIVIHSANPVGAKNMQQQLPQAITVSFLFLNIRACVETRKRATQHKE